MMEGYMLKSVLAEFRRTGLEEASFSGVSEFFSFLHTDVVACALSITVSFLGVFSAAGFMSYGRYYWVLLSNFRVNLSEANPKCISNYAAQGWANDSKLQIFAIKHKADTYSEYFTDLTRTDECVTVLELTPLKYITLHQTQEYMLSRSL